MKAQYLLVLFILAIAKAAQCQMPKSKQVYINMVEKFYQCLQSDKPISVQQSKILFGDEVTDIELELQEDYAQKIGDTNTYRVILPKDVDASNSLFLQYISKSKKELLQGYKNIDSIIVGNSVLYDDNQADVIYLIITFPNQKVIYFMLSAVQDAPTYIMDIFLSNGSSLFSRFENEGDNYSSIALNGVINDKDGFVYVRSGKGKQYPIVTTLKKDQRFYFTPDCESDWWTILDSDQNIIGYIHKSTIKWTGTRE